MKNRLEDMEYPGRGIIMGTTREQQLFCAYFVTGRSASSQARKFVNRGRIIATEPTDPETLAKGDPDLLIYNAIAWNDNVVAVSNGKQTDSVFTATACGIDNLSISNVTRQWNYEPDKPNFTPRISGRMIVTPSNYRYSTMELGIIKRRGEEKQAVREDFRLAPEFSDGNGKAYGITTYTGANEEPLPPYEGKPFTIPIEAYSPPGLCEELGDMVNRDFMVGIAAVIFKPSGKAEHSIRNFRG
jgi:IMP cyclohydrolase